MTRRHSRALFGAALSAIGLAACGEAAPQPSPTTGGASLQIEGAGFVLNTPDGLALRGVELEGATLYLALEDNGLVPVRMARIQVDPEDADILRHDFEVPDGEGGWQPACSPDPWGERWGFPMALPSGHPGYEGPVTLSCAAGAVAKCARFGYKPWAADADGTSLMELHAACVHMLRADYCGDDQPATRDGTEIDLYDDLGIQLREGAEGGEMHFEAGWGPNGAVCVAHTRWPDMLNQETLHARCPRLAATATCDEAAARAQGARLFNASRRQATEEDHEQ